MRCKTKRSLTVYFSNKATTKIHILRKLCQKVLYITLYVQGESLCSITLAAFAAALRPLHCGCMSPTLCPLPTHNTIL